MAKCIEWALPIVLSLVFLTGLMYVYKYRQLGNEMANLYDERCNNVNPFLISEKKLFLKMADMTKHPDQYTQREFKEILPQYADGIRKYLPAEQAWLAKQSVFLNRPDYKIIAPEYFQVAGEYELKMYQAYYDSDKYMLEALELPSTASTQARDELIRSHASAVDSRREYSAKYADAFDKGQKTFDLRKYLYQVPAPKCPPENQVIPDTSGAFDTIPVPIQIQTNSQSTS